MSQNPLPRGEQAEKPPVEESSLNLLEEKGRQLHVVLMWIIAIYCVVFFFVNLMIDQREQAVISIAGLPAVSITWLLYSYGYYYYSKLWNVFQISVLIILIVMFSGPDVFATIYFIPIILGSLITFQGKEKTTGYVVAGLVTALMAALQVYERQLAAQIVGSGSTAVLVERTINVVSTTLVVVLQAIFILRTNDAIQEKLIQKAEDVNRRNDQLKAAVFTRDKMMSVLSHDLRSPLALLYSGLDVLSPGKLSPEVQEKMIEQFKSRTGQTLDLVDNMLLWSRIQKDAVSYSPIAVNLEQIYRFVESYCRLLQSGKNIRFEFNFAHRDGLRVICDRDMVEAVFRNLISNAYKFTPEGGVITLSSNQCLGGWCFDVIDSGRGMSAEEVDMVNRGVSFSTEGTNHEKGNGLGIQLVQDF
ncbi:MAG: sensor histidine kinase, partial [Bacteroidota bacterium]